jgi:hypothetical protein
MASRRELQSLFDQLHPATAASAANAVDMSSPRSRTRSQLAQQMNAITSSSSSSSSSNSLLGHLSDVSNQSKSAKKSKETDPSEQNGSKEKPGSDQKTEISSQEFSIFLPKLLGTLTSMSQSLDSLSLAQAQSNSQMDQLKADFVQLKQSQIKHVSPDPVLTAKQPMIKQYKAWEGKDEADSDDDDLELFLKQKSQKDSYDKVGNVLHAFSKIRDSSFETLYVRSVPAERVYSNAHFYYEGKRFARAADFAHKIFQELGNEFTEGLLDLSDFLVNVLQGLMTVHKDAAAGINHLAELENSDSNIMSKDAQRALASSAKLRNQFHNVKNTMQYGQNGVKSSSSSGGTSASFRGGRGGHRGGRGGRGGYQNVSASSAPAASAAGAGSQ